MKVTPLTGEQGRFLVESESGQQPHLVDLQWQEVAWKKPIAFCSCQQCFAKGDRHCKHIRRVVEWEAERLGLHVNP